MTHDDILERLRKASGADRELDCYIHAELLRKSPAEKVTVVEPPYYVPQRYFFNPDPTIDWIGYDLLRVSPNYSDSIDAAVALVGRLLPGWRGNMNVLVPNNEGDYGASLIPPSLAWPTTTHGYGKSPALALLIALFEALKQKEAGA